MLPILFRKCNKLKEQQQTPEKMDSAPQTGFATG